MVLYLRNIVQSILLIPVRFIFRADASIEIGSGHVMRSSVLAEEAISRGYECIFVGTILGLEWVSARIAGLGFSQVIADEHSFGIVKQSDVLIVDSYSIPESDSFIAKKNWKSILSICDAVTPNYKSDIELRPSLSAVDLGHGAPIMLSGPEYVLIRKGIEKSVRDRSLGDALKVLIVGGGSDPFRFVDSITNIVSSMELNLEVHIFTAGRNYVDSSGRITRHPIGSSLDLIAKDIEVVLTTASTASLEFIAREIPTGVVCAVGNQEDIYIQLGRLGCASQLGVYNSGGSWEFDEPAIKELLESQERQMSLKKATYRLIDLKGAARVVDTLVALCEGNNH